MDKLKSMQVFVYVAQHGSFSGAAANFSITSTMIGKHIKYLETHLGTRLINRTTRRQSLTETGQIYYLECRRILDDIAEAENSLQTLENKPKGKVRINSPVTFGNIVLAPIVADFLRQYPDINIELILDNDLIDPLHEQVDAVFRIGGLASSPLIARQIGVYEMVFCASPDYLAKHGVPLSLADLTEHQCLGFSYGDVQASLALQIDTLAFDKQHSRLISNSGQALRVATLKSAGILLQPRLLICEDLSRGELIEILSDQVPTPSPINLIYKSKDLPLKTRVFIEFVMAAMRESS